MARAVDIHHWNEIRGHMKVKYGIQLVTELDTSGYVSQVKKKNKWPRINY